MFPAIVGIALILCMRGVFAPFFARDSTIGHDFSFFFPALLDGFYWYLKNGILEVPWFTPAFCAGMPSFADPQNLFYSPIQVLSFFTDPLTASLAALLFAGGVAYVGMYLYCVETLGVSAASAVLSACLWMFNGFVTHHHLVGHVTFLPVMAAPLVAWLIAKAAERGGYGIARWSYATFAGMVVTVCLYSGIAVLLVPFALSVIVLVALIVFYRPRTWLRLSVWSLIAVLSFTAMSATKLSAISALLAHLPRSQYRLPGFSSLSDLSFSIGAMYFFPDESIAQFVGGKMVNLNFGLGPHEFAFYLTPIPVVLVMAALVRRAVLCGAQMPVRRPLGRVSIVALLVCLAGCAIAVAANYYSPGWNKFLKNVPVLSSSTAPWRWLIVPVPVICVATALVLDSLFRGKARTVVSAALVIICLLLHLSSPRSTYENQGYDPSGIIEAFERARMPEFEPEIRFLGAHVDSNGNPLRVMNANDLIANGISQAFCYNPLFGYRLEMFDPSGLGPGNPRRVKGDKLNFKNPACYVFPRENDCQAGDLFSASAKDLDRIDHLLRYEPWGFEKPWWQKSAEWASKVSLGLSAFLIALSGIRTLTHRRVDRGRREDVDR